MEGLGEVLGVDCLLVSEIGDGAADLQDPVVRASAEVEFDLDRVSGAMTLG